MEDMRIESPKPKTGVIVTAVLASAVIFGGLGYYIGSMYETAPAGTATYASPSATESSTTSPSSAASATATSSSIYNNATHKVSFTIPKGWTAKESTPTDQSSLYVSVSDGVSRADTDRPSNATLKDYSSIKKLDTKNLGAGSLKDFLDKSAALSDPTYQNVDGVQTNGVSGYKAVSGPNQFGGGTHFFYARTDGSIVDLWLFDILDANSVSILESLKVN